MILIDKGSMYLWILGKGPWVSVLLAYLQTLTHILIWLGMLLYIEGRHNVFPIFTPCQLHTLNPAVDEKRYK